ncbi:MAG: YdcH family protein [Candidatus Aminicenantes bacterium]|nr:YdcH family protein [Candidatus Aminicenantes bacterium]
MDEQALKDLLLRENPAFRKLNEEHRACEEALEKLRRKAGLSAAEEVEEKALKKRKLALKDRMYIMMEDYRRSR